MKKLSLYEKKMTLTEYNVSVSFKLLCATFFNSSILLVFTSMSSANTWFDNGGLVYNAFVTIMFMIVVDHC